MTHGLVYIIISPDYPNEYPDDVTAAWIMTAPYDMKLRLDIKDFYMENRFDFVTVGNGNTVGKDRIWHHSGITSLSVIFSISNAMWIAMSSDSTVSKTGFAFYVKYVSDMSEYHF